MLGLCRQFGQLPSAVRAENADILRLLDIERLGRREEPDVMPEGGGEGGWPAGF